MQLTYVICVIKLWEHSTLWSSAISYEKARVLYCVLLRDSLGLRLLLHVNTPRFLFRPSVRPLSSAQSKQLQTLLEFGSVQFKLLSMSLQICDLSDDLVVVFRPSKQVFLAQPRENMKNETCLTNCWSSMASWLSFAANLRHEHRKYYNKYCVVLSLRISACQVFETLILGSWFLFGD